MKTAISLADSLYEQAEQAAREQGMSRSELYARALQAYLKQLDAARTTRQLDDLYAEEDSSLPPPLADLGDEVLRQAGQE